MNDYANKQWLNTQTIQGATVALDKPSHKVWQGVLIQMFASTMLCGIPFFFIDSEL